MRTACISLLMALAGPVYAANDANEIELSYRLKPGRDYTSTSVIDSITTVRVLEDRGIVAKSGGRLSATPVTLHVIGTQAVRYTSGSLRPDGSFPVEMRHLEKTTRLRAADGQEQVIPDRSPVTGMRVTALVEPGGTLREGSVEVSGVEPTLAEQMRQTMAAVLSQATVASPVKLSQERSAQQDMTMQLPVAGITSISLTMRVSHRLLGVEDGIARIEQLYTMDFGTPDGMLKLSAEGTGGGTTLYETTTQSVLSTDSNTMMKLTLDGAEGVIEVQMTSRQTQKMQRMLPDSK